jgi:hypothetical protein
LARGSVSMSREADLRAAREARWAAAIKANDVTLVTKSPVTKPPVSFVTRGGGPLRACHVDGRANACLPGAQGQVNASARIRIEMEYEARAPADGRMMHNIRSVAVILFELG